MAKPISMMLIAISAMFLSSCIPIHSRYSDDFQKADARLKQVISAIKDKDEKAIKSMFSQRALEEAENFDEDIEYLFSFVEGDIESWKRRAGSVSGSKYYNRLVISKTWYRVFTDKETYLFFLLEYPTDKDNPENVGLYMLQVIKEEDEDTQFDAGQKILCPGIYRPEE